MKIASLPVRTERERQRLIVALSARQLPYMVSVKQGVPRSYMQNRTNRMWCREAEEQGDMTAEDYRGLLKLEVGVPILCAEDDVFRAAWEQDLAHLPYDVKLRMMQSPIDLPVTRRMSVKAESAYLDGAWRYLTEHGIVLTDPSEPGVMRADNGRS